MNHHGRNRHLCADVRPRGSAFFFPDGFDAVAGLAGFALSALTGLWLPVGHVFLLYVHCRWTSNSQLLTIQVPTLR